MKKPPVTPAEAPSAMSQPLPLPKGSTAPVRASQRFLWPIWAPRSDVCGACNNGLSDTEGDIDA